jgi:hypothetical protein
VGWGFSSAKFEGSAAIAMQGKVTCAVVLVGPFCIPPCTVSHIASHDRVIPISMIV